MLCLFMPKNLLMDYIMCMYVSDVKIYFLWASIQFVE